MAVRDAATFWVFGELPSVLKARPEDRAPPWQLAILCARGADQSSEHAAVKFTPRNRLPHDVPGWVEEGNFFFITVKCEPPGRNQLCQAGRGDAALAAARFYHEQLKWHCRLLLLMPDHVHAIIAFPQNSAMRRTIRNWKRYLATHEKIAWQEDFFDHRLRNRHEEAEKISYISMNPVRKGLCERMEDWPWVFRPADRPPPVLGN